MFEYNQRPIDDKARDNHDRIFKHGKYAAKSEKLKEDKPKGAKPKSLKRRSER